jgi:predicted metal-dependent phosphoesterase TrpH
LLIERPGKADLHMHTDNGDGTASVMEMLDYGATLGLDLIAITDHDSLLGTERALEAAQRRDYPFEVVPGVEVTSLSGHVLCLWVQHPIRMLQTLEKTIYQCHEQGGLAIAPHPMSALTRTIGERALLRIWRSNQAGIHWDAVETMNPSVAARVSAARVRRLNQEVLHLPEVGFSDAHHLEGIGTGYTTFPGRTGNDFRAALKNGTTEPHGVYWDFGEHVEIARRKFRRIGRQLSGQVRP